MSVVVRAATILDVLADSPHGMSLAQIAARTGMPRSSVHRIVRELEQHHYVMAASRYGGYRLGPGLLKLAVRSHAQLVSAMRPVMVTLAREIHENVDLAVLSGRDVVVVEQVASSQRLQAVTEVGGVFPVHASSLGKALLAQLTDDQVVKLVVGPLPAFTAHTITAPDALIQQLRDVRSSGLAYDIDEHDTGISSVATVVHNSLGVVQALSIVAPSPRFADRRADLVHALRQVRRAQLSRAATSPL